MKMVIENFENEFNVKKLMWRLGYKITYLVDATGISYKKLQRLLSVNRLEEYRLIDVLKISKAMGYTSLDTFIQDTLEVNKYIRTEKMDELLERAVLNQIKYGTMMEKDVEDILLEAQWSQKVKTARKRMRNVIISECLAKQKPDDIMELYHIPMLIGPDKTCLYLRKDKQK